MDNRHVHYFNLRNPEKCLGCGQVVPLTKQSEQGLEDTWLQQQHGSVQCFEKVPHVMLSEEVTKSTVARHRTNLRTVGDNMEKHEIVVGAHYIAKVSGKRAAVQILAVNKYGGWDAKNLHTQRHVRIRSARRLHPLPENNPLQVATQRNLVEQSPVHSELKKLALLVRGATKGSLQLPGDAPQDLLVTIYVRLVNGVSRVAALTYLVAQTRAKYMPRDVNFLAWVDGTIHKGGSPTVLRMGANNEIEERGY